MPLSQADSEALFRYFTAMSWSIAHCEPASVRLTLESLIHEIENGARDCKVTRVEAIETQDDGDVVEVYCTTKRSYRFTEGEFEELTEDLPARSSAPRSEGPVAENTSSSDDGSSTTTDGNSAPASDAEASDGEAQPFRAETTPPEAAAEFEHPSPDAQSDDEASSGEYSTNSRESSSESDWSSDED